MFSLGTEWIQIGDLKISEHLIVASRLEDNVVWLYTSSGQVISFFETDRDHASALAYHNSRKARPYDQEPAPLARGWVDQCSHADADRRWAEFLQNRGEPIQAAHASTDCPINPSECDEAS